jgi:hypothetical protein
MKSKHIPIGSRPAADPAAAWLRDGDGASGESRQLCKTIYTARLTIDVTPELRGRIKVAAFRRGRTVADVVRELLEERFPASLESDP